MDYDQEKDKPEEKDDVTSDGPVVAFKLLLDLGELKAGCVLHLPQDKGQALVDAGVLEMASVEDVNAEEVVEEEDELDAAPAMIENSVKRLMSRVEKGLVETVEKKINQQRTEVQDAIAGLRVHAEVKQHLYRSHGEYIYDIVRAKKFGNKEALQKVNKHAQDQAEWLQRKTGIVEKSVLGVNETSNAEGGYLLVPQFGPDVYHNPHNQLNLLDFGEQIQATNNTLNYRYIDESSLANGSIFGGLNIYAVAEGGSLTASKPAWNNLQLLLKKFVCFAYYTSEVFQDADKRYGLFPQLDEYVTKAFVYNTNQQIIQGTTIEGLANSPGIVTVTKSSNDTSFTSNPNLVITYADLAQMWGRVYPDSQTSPQGMWLFNPALLGALSQMTYTFSGGTTPAWSINYDAQKGLQGIGPLTPYSIFGKPAYPLMAMSAAGAAFDIAYIDFATCVAFRSPFRVDVSDGPQFTTDQIAIRYVSRFNMATRFRSAVTGQNGSTTYSAVVTRSAAGT